MTRPMPAPTSSARVRRVKFRGSKGRIAEGTLHSSGSRLIKNCRDVRASTLGSDF